MCGGDLWRGCGGEGGSVVSGLVLCVDMPVTKAALHPQSFCHGGLSPAFKTESISCMTNTLKVQCRSCRKHAHRTSPTPSKPLCHVKGQP